MLSPNNLFQPDVYVHTYVRSQLLWSLSLDDATLGSLALGLIWEIWGDKVENCFQTREQNWGIDTRPNA